MRAKIEKIEFLINSYKDFFEIIETEEKGTGDFGKIIIDKLKCKLCGDLFEDFNPSSAADTRYVDQYERHIRLHETINRLKLNA